MAQRFALLPETGTSYPQWISVSKKNRKTDAFSGPGWSPSAVSLWMLPPLLHSVLLCVYIYILQGTCPRDKALKDGGDIVRFEIDGPSGLVVVPFLQQMASRPQQRFHDTMTRQCQRRIPHQ